MTAIIKTRNAVFILLAFFAVAGCSYKHAETSYAPSGAEKYSLQNTPVATDRMLIWNGSLTLDVGKVDETISKVIGTVEENGGYIESKSVTGTDVARLRIRIPSGRMGSVMDRLALLGTETYRYVSSEDVTERYIDTEARLKNAISLRDRLKTLLAKANTVKDILEVEKELTRIQSDIDSMEGILKAMKGKVDYAAIDLTLRQKTILGPLGYVVKGVGWVVKKLFVIQ